MRMRLEWLWTPVSSGALGGCRGVEIGAMLLDVMVAEAEVVGELGKGAAAAVGIGEVAQTGAIGFLGMRISGEEFGYKRKSPRGALIQLSIVESVARATVIANVHASKRV